VKKIQFTNPHFAIVLSHFSCFGDGINVSEHISCIRADNYAVSS